MIDIINKSIINRCVKLTVNGFLISDLVKERIRSFTVSEFARVIEKEMMKTWRKVVANIETGHGSAD